MDLGHPKLGLYKEIKIIEATLNKPNEPKLNLEAFILSPTKFTDLLNLGSTEKAELEQRHVLFMEDGATVYLKKLFECLS